MDFVLRRARAAYAEHCALLAESEALRVEQLKLVHAQSAVSDPSPLAAAAARAHGDSYIARLRSIATGWEAGDLAMLLAEFRASPVHLIVAGSAASGAGLVASFVKARATGALFDALARASAGDGDVAAGFAWAAAPLLTVLLCVVGSWFAAVARDFFFARARARRIVAVRVRYLAAMLSQDLAFHDAHRSGELALRLAGDPEALDDAVLFTLERLLLGALALAAGGYVALTDWRTLALGLALRLPFALQFVERSVQTTSAYERLEAATAAAAGARAAEVLGSVRALQANTAEAAEVAGYAALLGAHVRVRRASAVAVSLLRHTEKIVVAASDVVVLAVRGGGGWDAGV